MCFIKEKLIFALLFLLLFISIIFSVSAQIEFNKSDMESFVNSHFDSKQCEILINKHETHPTLYAFGENHGDMLSLKWRGRVLALLVNDLVEKQGKEFVIVHEAMTKDLEKEFENDRVMKRDFLTSFLYLTIKKDSILDKVYLRPWEREDVQKSKTYLKQRVISIYQSSVDKLQYIKMLKSDNKINPRSLSAQMDDLEKMQKNLKDIQQSLNNFANSKNNVRNEDLVRSIKEASLESNSSKGKNTYLFFAGSEHFNVKTNKYLEELLKGPLGNMKIIIPKESSNKEELDFCTKNPTAYQYMAELERNIRLSYEVLMLFYLEKVDGIYLRDLFKLIFNQKIIQNYEELTKKILQASDPALNDLFVEYVLPQERAQGHSEWIDILLKKGDLALRRKIIYSVLVKDFWKSSEKYNQWIESLVSENNRDIDLTIARNILDDEKLKDRKKWQKEIFNRFDQRLDQDGFLMFLKFSLSQSDLKESLYYIEKLIDKKNKEIDEAIVLKLSSYDFWESHPEFIEKLMSRDNFELDRDIILFLLSKKSLAKHSYLIEKMIKKNNKDLDLQLISSVLCENNSYLLKIILEKNNEELDQAIIYNFIREKKSLNYPEIVDSLLKKENLLPVLIEALFKSYYWLPHIKESWVGSWLKKNNPKIDEAIATFVFSSRDYTYRAEWVEYLKNKNDVHLNERINTSLYMSRP